MIKKLFAQALKIKIHLVKNSIIDFFKGYTFNYAKSRNNKLNFSNKIAITQKIQQTKSVKAKVKNFTIAIKKIESIVIRPNEIFSFWKVVGTPSKERGFMESRSIINGKITPTVGGGLCQLAGLIYYVSLKANLQILERYNHTSDIYTDETRFTPLGSDAAVVYGYKDLKIQNNLKSSIAFSFIITDKSLTIVLNSIDKIEEHAVSFQKKTNTKVATLINGREVATSIYKNI